MRDYVIFERRGAIGHIVLNAPETMNAIGLDMARELVAATQALAHDRSVRCVVLGAAGPNFMAGGDIRYFSDLLALPAAERDVQLSRLITEVGIVVSHLRAMPIPVIGAVRGAVAGFGFSLMCACDLVVASSTTMCKLAYGQLGASPDGGGSYHLPRLLGERCAMEIALLDERMDAQRALALGLVSRVVADNTLETEVATLAARLAAQATGALGGTKRLISAAFDSTLAAQLEAERVCFLALAASDDFAEGVNAFIARRKPQFRGS